MIGMIEMNGFVEQLIDHLCDLTYDDLVIVKERLHGEITERLNNAEDNVKQKYLELYQSYYEGTKV
jgi:hypothetical protein